MSTKKLKRYPGAGRRLRPVDQRLVVHNILRFVCETHLVENVGVMNAHLPSSLNSSH